MLLSMMVGVAFTLAMATSTYAVLARSWFAAWLLLFQLIFTVAMRVLAS